VIRVLAHEKNLGVCGNHEATFKACRGKYVAMLDADDYWMSPVKLQTQAQLLERHPEYSCCFHRVLVVHPDGSRDPYVSPESGKAVLTTEDLIRRNVIHPSAMMVRHGLIPRYPDWYTGLGLNDWPMILLNSLHGGAFFLNETWTTYRMHVGGIWSMRSQMVNLEIKTRCLENMQHEFDRKYRPVFLETLAGLYHEKALKHLLAGEKRDARECIKKSFLRSAPGPDFVPRAVLALEAYAPPVHGLIKRLRGAVRGNS
jgi:glycosyltransferase involved in cell wall biosynthesis